MNGPDIKRGGSPRPIHEYITDDKNGLNWLKIGDIDRNAKYINHTSSKIIKEGLNSTTLVKRGDFILSNSMSFGRPYILNIDTCIHDGWLTFQNIKIDILDRNFLYFLLLHPKTQNEFKVISAGSGVQNLKKETVAEVSLLFPPLPEQKRIVGVLEVWDRGIETLERKIVVKENIKKGLLQRMMNCELSIVNEGVKKKKVFAPKLRLPGFDEPWEEKRLEKIANVKMGQSPKSEYYNELDDGVPLIQGNADIKKQKTISRIFTSACTKIANLDDVILTVRAPVGEIGIVNQKEVCIGRGVCSIVANNKNSQDMIFYLLSYFKQQFRRFEQGSTFTAINSTDVKGFKIKIPKLEEQKAIAEVLTTADEEIEVLRKKLDIWKDQKKFLLNNLVTGNIRVPK